MSRHLASCWLALTLLLTLLISVSPSQGQQWMLRVSQSDHQLVGKPVQWEGDTFTLLARDGRMHTLKMELARQGETIKEPFSSYSHSEIRSQLMREFTKEMEVQTTAHYIVAFPAGQRDWTTRFEDLYREMIRYFNIRGIAIHEPDFPLVAVVLPTYEDFVMYAAMQGDQAGGSVLGYYQPNSNRVAMYDVTAGGRIAGDWRVNAATVVHEAAHQTAFNVGIHSRYTMPPRWLAEGLGTLFEAPGVYSSETHPRLADRINEEQLVAFRRYFSDGIPDGMLASLVADDANFGRFPYPAYALSWAFTFMTAETSPSKLSEYLQITAEKEPFSDVLPGDRLADFQSVFGDNFAMIQARLERYIAGL